MFEKKKKIISCVLGLSIIFTIFQFSITFAENAEERTFNFSDVPNDYKYYTQIKNLFDRGIVNGNDDGTFQPERKVNRAEAITMITKAYNIDAVSTDDLVFADTSADEWYAEALQAGINEGIISGFPDGSFGPGKNITLMQVFKMALEAGNKEIPQATSDVLADVHMDDWYSGYALYAKDHHILYISADNTVDPNQELTRGKMADVLYRILKSDEGYEFGIASYYGDSFNGRRTASGEILDNAAMVAAHKSLPFGTKVKVTNPDNGKTIEVTIVDRGPYIYGRLLDLSKGAFSAIESPGRGITKIQIKVVTEEDLAKEKEEMLKHAYPYKNRPETNE